MKEQHLEIRHKPKLAERTSMGLGGTALAEIFIRDLSRIGALPEMLEALGGIPVVLGAGSNVIAADMALPLVLLRLDVDAAPEVIREEEKSLHVRVCGNFPLPALLGRLAAFGASGLEGLAGIPGSVGGAVAMNAGSFGDTFGDALERITIYVPGKGLQELGRESLMLGYRHMAVKSHDPARDGTFWVTEVVLKLRKDDPGAIRAVMKSHMAKKKASQPVHMRSAGCVYKNPSADMPAGRLLEEAGMRGRKKGGMAFSSLHANFLVNEGGGSYAAAMDLMEEAEKKVLDRFGVRLEREVILWA